MQNTLLIVDFPIQILHFKGIFQPTMLDSHIKTYQHLNLQRILILPWKLWILWMFDGFPQKNTPWISARNHPLGSNDRCSFRQWTGLGLGPFWKNMTRWAGKSYLKWSLTGEHYGKSTINNGFTIDMFDYWRISIHEEDSTFRISLPDISWQSLVYKLETSRCLHLFI